MKCVRGMVPAAALVLVAAVGAAPVTAQQTGTITGRVTDAASGQPLVGAQMIVAGTNLGTLTNADGQYAIRNVPPGEREVRAMLIGYSQLTQTVTVPPGGSATADFQLETSAVELDAVVVNVATGREQRARELGSKVANIEVADINPAPITSFADILGGRAEGVIMQDVNGTTGTSQRIRIRGANSLSLSNEPLIFIDGVQISNEFGMGDQFGVGGQQPNRLSDLNPSDIQSIEVVKGPAASALYGTAAANGVLLITTKRGRPGDTQWTFFAEAGLIDDVTDYPVNTASYQVNDPSQPVLLPDGSFNSDAYEFCPNFSAAAGECRQDGTLRYNTLMDDRTRPFSTGDRQRYGASVRGGTEEVRYFLSGQLENETGVIDFNTLDKFNFRGNVDARLNDRTDVSISFGYADSNLGLNNNDNSIFSPILNGLAGEAWFIPPSENQPDVVNQNNYGFQFNMTDLRNLVTHQDVDRYTTSANVRFRPTSWLTLTANGGLDLSSIHNYETLQPDVLPIAESYARGYRASLRANNYLYSAFVSAISTFALSNDLVSTTTLGGNYTRDHSRNTYCYGSSLVPGTASCGTTAALFEVDEDFFEIRTLGAYLQQEFGWRDRVFLAAALRGDDNSAFGADFGFVYYPSVSLSWVVGDEEWFPQVDWLSQLRVRSAYGESGLRPGFRDAVTLYSPTTVASPAGDVPGVTLSSTGNVQLEPEKTREWEIGFDAGLFDNRLSVDFTYFNKKSRDALIERRLPGSLGLTETVFDNLGSIRNSGTELTASLNLVDRENFGLVIDFSNTTLSNEVEELGEGVEPIIFNRGLQRHAEGYPAGAFFQNEIIFSDPDGDGLLTLDDVSLGDEVYIGPALPTWQRSLGARVRLFDWISVSTLFEGRGGHYTGNDSESFRCGFRSTRGCPAVGDPTTSIEEQAAYIADRYLGSALGYVEKADFYKWRELSVTLTPPASLTGRLGQLNGLRLTIAGRNLATFTDYPGLDPETVEGGGSANFSQSEFNTQPPVRYLMLRLDYSF